MQTHQRGHLFRDTIGLGCMGFSWAYTTGPPVDATAAVATLRDALEMGAACLDTADMYGPFTNEVLVGKAIAGRGRDLPVATKGGLVVTDRQRVQVRSDARPASLRAAVEGSLRRLDIESIPLYYLHRVDPNVRLEDSWGCLADMVAEGKLGSLGICEASVDELGRAHAIHPVAAVQSELSIWTRDAIAAGILSWCREHSATFVAFSPLGRGYFGGALPRRFAPDDLRASHARFTRAAREGNQHILDAVRAAARELSCTPAQVALAWVLHQEGDIVAIPGSRNLDRIAENLSAQQVRLTAQQFDSLTAGGDAVGGRYERTEHV